MANVYH